MKQISSDQELIDFFISSFESAGTRTTYRRRLKHYQKFIELIGVTIGESTAINVQMFLTERSHTLNSSSMKLQIASLKSLYKYGVQIGYLSSNIMSAFKLSNDRVIKPKSDLVTEQDVLKLLKGIDTDTLKGIRQHALICLTFYSFMKISQALNIRLGDIIEIDEGYVAKIYGKSKERLVPIPAEAIQSLKNYIYVLPSSLTAESKVFIRTERKGSVYVEDEPFTGAQANTQLRNYRSAAGLSDKLTYETMRQAGLRRFVGSGGTLSQARELYGCKSLDTIELILGSDFNGKE